MHLKIRRRDGVESLTILEEGEFKLAIDGCIRGELRKYANNSNFENFESALCSTSGSMSLNDNPEKKKLTKKSQIIFFFPDNKIIWLIKTH